MKDGWKKTGRVGNLFFTFLKFGLFTFGGGWNIIAQIEKEYVENKKWLTEEELLDFTSVGKSLPGLMVGNVSLLFGYHAAGVPGAFAALLGMTLPSILVMFCITFMYAQFAHNPYVAQALVGVRAAVVPIVLCAMLKLIKPGIKDAVGVVLAVAAMAICVLTKVNSLLIVLCGAVVGLVVMEVRNQDGVS